MNPLDWSGDAFLTLYVSSGGALLVALWLWRDLIGPGRGDGAGLDTLHIAYLAGGPERAADTALVGLFEAGAASLDSTSGGIAFDRSAMVPPALQPFRALGPGATDRTAFHQAAAGLGGRVRDELVRRGLSPGPAAVARYEAGVWCSLAAMLLLGGSKVCVGLSRARPVGILCFLLFLTVLTWSAMAARRPYRSRAGTALLGRLRDGNARAARAPVPAELPLAFALTGAAVLDGRDYRPFIAPPRSGDGGSGGGDGGGDGGGGCGGCSG